MSQFTLTATSYKLAVAGDLPKEVIIQDKALNEKLRLISELDEEDKNMVFRMIDKMLTTKKFKEFFDKNMASL